MCTMHQKKRNNFIRSAQGFALFYSVIIISLILTIAISISNITYRQTLLSNLAKDSQIAFYQADAGIECGLYYDVKQGSFPLGMTLATAQTNLSSINCGGNELVLMVNESSAVSNHDYFVYQEGTGNTLPCYKVVFDKVKTPGVNTIDAHGYNLCGEGPKRVERALHVTY